MPIAPGTRVGSYEVVTLLGEGGMGQVYRARDTKLGRDVALKVLPALVANDPDRLARFRREAHVLASLNDPHIAQIYGFEDAGGTHALVMELVDGPTLADRIASGPLPLTDALAIAQQIASALETAHEQGIVHRDLKPANVKVREDDTVKVLDFGLAKAFAPAGESSVDAANSPTITTPAMTELGMILGTAAYMSPEQARGRPADKRADIWAFGVVLFEMLTGRRLFDGETVSDTLAAVLRQEIDWRALPADTPPAVRRLVTRCLDRDPKQRLRDIGEARVLLSGALDEPTSAPVPPASSRLRGALPWAVAAVAVLAAAGALAWARVARTPSSSASDPVTRQRTTLADDAMMVAVSNDGETLAYVVHDAGGGTHLAARALDQFDAKPIPGTDHGTQPVFSPDGQWIAYTLGQSQIRKIRVSGGASVPICDGNLFSGGAWGGDDTIVFSGANGLMRVPASGGTPEALTTLDTAKGETWHLWPQFLPGGRQLLFTVIIAGTPHLAVLDLATRRYHTVVESGIDGRYAGGFITYLRDTTLFARPFDLERLAVTGAEVPVVDNVSTRGNGIPMADYAVTSRGLLAYVEGRTEEPSTLAWADRRGVTQNLPGDARQLWGPGRLSPDGRHVVSPISDGHGSSDIWVVDVVRGTMTRLTNSGGEVGSPIWTPDGRRIVYRGAPAGVIGGGFAVYSVAADGSDHPRLLVKTADPPRPTSFTPDGKTLLFDLPDANKWYQLYSMPFDGAGAAVTPRRLHPDATSEADGEVSPDGQWVAYHVYDFPYGAAIYVQAFPGPGAKVRVSTEGSGASPRWSRNGRELYYMSANPGADDADGANGIYAVDIPAGSSMQPGTPHLLFHLRLGSTWDVTPDPNRFLVELAPPATTGSTIAIVTNWFDELRRRVPPSQ
jgi:serine/threonine-protein kinase